MGERSCTHVQALWFEIKAILEGGHNGKLMDIMFFGISRW